MGEEAVGSSSEVIHVAVGTKLMKEKQNLLWVIRKFPGAEVVLIHVHVPSKGIPMMGTEILPSIASESVIKRYRKEEREGMTELMLQYISFCERKKVTLTLIHLKTGTDVL